MTDRAPFFYNNGSFWFNETETTTNLEFLLVNTTSESTTAGFENTTASLISSLSPSTAAQLISVESTTNIVENHSLGFIQFTTIAC